MERIIQKVKSDKSLWKAIRLRFYTICAAFSVMWVITGSPVTSVGLTAAQQGVSFGIHYLFEKKEEENECTIIYPNKQEPRNYSEELNIKREIREIKTKIDKENSFEKEIELLGTGR